MAYYQHIWTRDPEVATRMIRDEGWRLWGARNVLWGGKTEYDLARLVN